MSSEKQLQKTWKNIVEDKNCNGSECNKIKSVDESAILLLDNTMGGATAIITTESITG
jgi:hypothetical protein